MMADDKNPESGAGEAKPQTVNSARTLSRPFTARAELPRDACDEVAPSSSNRGECAACATTPGIRQGSRWSIDTPG